MASYTVPDCSVLRAAEHERCCLLNCGCGSIYGSHNIRISARRGQRIEQAMPRRCASVVHNVDRMIRILVRDAKLLPRVRSDPHTKRMIALSTRALEQTQAFVLRRLCAHNLKEAFRRRTLHPAIPFSKEMFATQTVLPPMCLLAVACTIVCDPATGTFLPALGLRCRNTTSCAEERLGRRRAILF